MQGKSLAAIGVALVLGGGVLLYSGYEAGSPAVAAAAWAAILGGAVALMAGVSRFMGGFMEPQHAAESDLGSTEVRLLIQCMGSIATADGYIQDEEMDTVLRVNERVLGLRMDRAEVAGMLSDLDEFDLKASLEKARPSLSRQMRERIVKSCYLVMMSDRVADRAENLRIHEIGRALGFSDQETDDFIAMAGV